METRLTQWKAGKFTMLVEDTMHTSRSLISNMKRDMTKEIISKIFTNMEPKGQIRAAVQFAALRGKGGILKGLDIDSKSGKTVLEVLR